jgi:hypothetical protein
MTLLFGKVYELIPLDIKLSCAEEINLGLSSKLAG